MALATTSIKLTPSMVPSDESIIFKDSSFFKQANDPSLPSPAQVRAIALERDGIVKFLRPRPVRFPSLNLLVKYGHEIKISEGQCLWALRRLLPEVPVPEVYGWCEDGRQVFIYMELIQGDTLEGRWEELVEEDRVQICKQLKLMVGSLNRLEQDPLDNYVGHIGRQALHDIIFISSCSPPAGPFLTVSSFHDFFAALPIRRPTAEPHFMRPTLNDSASIRFTHGDLHRSNILLTRASDEPPRVIAIIDWTQSGWLPDYWEYCKAIWTADYGSEWMVKYVPTFLEPLSTTSVSKWEFSLLFPHLRRIVLYLQTGNDVGL